MSTLLQQSRTDMLSGLCDAMLSDIFEAVRLHGADPELFNIIATAIVWVTLEISKSSRDKSFLKVIGETLIDPSRLEM